MNPIKQAKLEKIISESEPNFCSEVRSLTLSQIKDTLSRISLDVQATNMAKDEDEGLAMAKADVKEFSGPYRESLKKLKQKIEFVVSVLEEKNIKE